MSDVAMKYFYATAIHGSMRAASQKMNVAVSSVSRQIAQLEAAMGMPLLETGRRSVKLTTAGQMVFDYYQAQMADREAFTARLEALRGMRMGTVELAVGEGCTVQAVQGVLETFQSRYPGVELALHTVSTAELVRMVVDDEVHIAIGAQVPSDPKVRIRTSARQPLMVVSRPDHAVAKRGAVTLQDLSAHDLCLSPRDTRIRQLLSAAEMRHQVWLRATITTNSVHTMREMALSGRAATILPRAAVLADLEDGCLVATPLCDVEADTTTVDLVTRLGRQLPHAATLALSLLEQQVHRWGQCGGYQTGAPVTAPMAAVHGRAERRVGLEAVA
ncbi:LysR substrate-binding domain-containing protein [Nitrospirillum sp. BR 11164]|uniref:LysR family transcriptional regulator n=1 Tax=Nitrospirillum sp. BR 11164 TaxID=3104324 RepID=UPI002AFF4FDE|nr:LysR substrate-binding domain-containing protein [Nitrospirillum sp. BR 11164]MEA1648996.1 LysR substrate-binding domain-containing protein [Nitrospirillum sp. BR 11164]